METFNSEDFEKYQEVKKQVEEIKGFYGHLVSFIVVMAALIFVNLRFTPTYLWFFYPMLGWGTGLFFHAVRVFHWFPFMGKGWEEKKIKEFMEEERRNQNKYQ